MQYDLVSQLRSYQPSQDAIDTLRKKKLVIFAGITSAGKNAIMNELVKTGKFHDLITSTTRAPRENNGVLERDGVDYHFLTTETALAKVRDGAYLEVAPVHGHINGLLAEEVSKASGEGMIPIVDVDVQGVQTFKNMSDNVVAIFVVPPSYDEWIRRMRNRYPTDEAFLQAWPPRRESAIMELQEALSKPYYHFIVNEELTDAVRAAESIARNQDQFNQIDKSYHIWAERILAELKAGRGIE
ncbi:hypothetical protein KBD11_01930 [Candidatus Saccharibacteria bacterium]|nr:hypothetical protein [Candidatus Saccharibacteria bacterium]